MQTTENAGRLAEALKRSRELFCSTEETPGRQSAQAYGYLESAVEMFLEQTAPQKKKRPTRRKPRR
jgi:hypothetical protein